MFLASVIKFNLIKFSLIDFFFNRQDWFLIPSLLWCVHEVWTKNSSEVLSAC